MNYFSATNPHLYIAIFISIINGILLCFAGYKFLQIIQLSGYKIKGYFVWLKDTKSKYMSRVCMVAFLSCCVMMVWNCIFDGIDSTKFASYLGIAFYLWFSIQFIIYTFHAPKKTPLKITRRMERYIGFLFILTAGATFGIISLFTLFVPHVRYASVGLTPILLPLLIMIIHLSLVPFENLNNKRYIAWAKRRLGKNPTLIKIGITGSFGKTSTKNFLNTILSVKYKVCISPHSFNTPLGLTRVVLDYLKPEDQILICEMGARHIGDIQVLTNIIHPQYAILTGVAEQHLATFGSIANIAKTKNELIKGLPIYGFAVFNGDNEICKDLQAQCTCGSVSSSINDQNAYVHAKDVVFSENGIEFTLVIVDNEIRCSTSLIGEHNLENILMCCALAYKLGLSLKEIKRGIKKIKPIAHRLELTNSNGIKILDDSYNSNVLGSVSALKTLKIIEGNNRIVVTPGLVELGNKEFEKNVAFGEQIAEVADYAIIVNDVNKLAIQKGMVNKGFAEEKMFFVPNLEYAQLKLKDIAKSGDVVLFENDLPDNYT